MRRSKKSLLGILQFYTISVKTISFLYLVVFFFCSCFFDSFPFLNNTSSFSSYYVYTLSNKYYFTSFPFLLPLVSMAKTYDNVWYFLNSVNKLCNCTSDTLLFKLGIKLLASSASSHSNVPNCAISKGCKTSVQ